MLFTQEKSAERGNETAWTAIQMLAGQDWAERRVMPRQQQSHIIWLLSIWKLLSGHRLI